jgi:hypothetical protein
LHVPSSRNFLLEFREKNVLIHLIYLKILKLFIKDRKIYEGFYSHRKCKWKPRNFKEFREFKRIKKSGEKE